MTKIKTQPMRAKTKGAGAGPTKAIHRILVVDDDPFFCHRNAEVLIRHGYEVNAAENAEVGWEELQLNHYHLLITESELPNLKGVELVKKLRSARMFLPVIMATEKLPPAGTARLFRLRPVMTLLKPYTAGEFLSAVNVILAARRPAGRKTAPPNRPSPPVVKLRPGGF
jgi:DNA-binding response OmpR family regulator